MFTAYIKTFLRIGLTPISLRAETGPIGGDLSHEFQILAKTGESTLYYDKELVVWTNHSGHFQTKDHVKRKVGLSLDKFAPMSSKKIHTMIDQHYS